MMYSQYYIKLWMLNIKSPLITINERFCCLDYTYMYCIHIHWTKMMRSLLPWKEKISNFMWIVLFMFLFSKGLFLKCELIQFFPSETTNWAEKLQYICRIQSDHRFWFIFEYFFSIQIYIPSCSPNLWRMYTS